MQRPHRVKIRAVVINRVTPDGQPERFQVNGLSPALEHEMHAVREPSRVERSVHQCRVVIAGQHQDGAVESAESPEHIAHKFRGHTAIIEQIPGDDHGIDRPVNREPENLFKTVKRVLRVDVASYMEVRGVEQLERSAGQSMPPPTVIGIGCDRLIKSIAT